MASFAARSLASIRRDSWPPAQIRKDNMPEEDNSSDDGDIPSISKNPLIYFLTPSTPIDEPDDFEFDFDAGIEDSTQPREVVRSVSPSTLDGLRKYKPKKDVAILDDDDDEEDYIRFTPGYDLPLDLRDFASSYPRPSSVTPKVAAGRLSPPSFHVGSPRGRSRQSFAPLPRPSRGRTRSLPLQRRHSWREPSPDVWSIDEQPEEEALSELGSSFAEQDGLGKHKKPKNNNTQAIDIPAAKPVKKVRFVLPLKE